jgi:glycosyltransferase involved in cell wall biosynthesis
MRNSYSLSMIIPAYGSPEELKSLLNSIKAHGSPAIEVWVIDDGSDPPLEEVVKQFNFNYHYQENRGPCAARNQGAKLANAKTFFFLDSDTELLPDTLPKALELIKKPDFNIVSIIYHPESLSKGFVPEYKCLFDFYSYFNCPEGPVPELAGQSCLFRKDVFLDIGGWDENFNRPDMEHEEFSNRIKKKYTINLFHGIYVKHHFPKMKKLLVSLFHRSMSWTRLKINGKVKFDGFHRTRSTAMAIFLPFLSILSLIGSIFNPLFTAIFLILIFLFFLANLTFFKFLFNRTSLFSGIIFIGIHFLVQFSVSLGALFGLLTFWKAKW